MARKLIKAGQATAFLVTLILMYVYGLTTTIATIAVVLLCSVLALDLACSVYDRRSGGRVR